MQAVPLRVRNLQLIVEVKTVFHFMNHNKAITLRVGYLRRRLTNTEIKFNKLYKAQIQEELKIVQTKGVIFLDKMFKKLSKIGYTFREKKLSAEGLYHVWGTRSGKQIYGVLDPYGESLMMLMPEKKRVTHIAIPSGKQYLTTVDTFLVVLLHPDD